MPKAVVSQETERHDLKTLEGAFVELRRLSYGEMLRRRDMNQTIRQAPKRAGNGSGEMEGVFHISQVTHYNFKKAVVDHNLEDESGRNLNLGDPKDLERLDPRVAGEIEDIIIAMNEPPEPDEGEDGKPTPSFRGSGETGDSVGSEGSG